MGRVLGMTFLTAVLGCASSGAVEPPNRFEGHFSTGFEVASFRPCGSQASWWVTGGEELFRRYRDLGVSDYAEVYAIVRGDTTSIGQYGHLGAYVREVEVVEVIEVVKDGRC